MCFKSKIFHQEENGKDFLSSCWILVLSFIGNAPSSPVPYVTEILYKHLLLALRKKDTDAQNSKEVASKLPGEYCF